MKERGPGLKRCRGYGKALYTFKGYSAVIPQLQNIYGPEREAAGWCFGFKYESGVFEYFTFKTKAAAAREHEKLCAAVEAFWGAA